MFERSQPKTVSVMRCDGSVAKLTCKTEAVLFTASRPAFKAARWLPSKRLCLLSRANCSSIKVTLGGWTEVPADLACADRKKSSRASISRLRRFISTGLTTAEDSLSSTFYILNYGLFIGFQLR